MTPSALPLESVLAQLRVSPTLVGNRSRPVHLSRHVAAVAPYVDNANVLAANRRSAIVLHRGIVEELRRRGFELHDEHVNETVFEFLGLVMEGANRLLGHARRRAWRLFRSLDDVAHRIGMTGDAMQVLVGHVLHHFGLRPEFIACLESTFWFITEQAKEWAPLPESVRAEIVVARGLIFQCYARLDRPVSRKVFCTDSSLFGYELAVTDALNTEVLDAIRWRERWRFVELVEPVILRAAGSKDGQVAGAVPLASDQSAFMDWALSADTLTDISPVLKQERARGVVQRPRRRPRDVALFNGAVPALPQPLTWPSRYAPVVSLAPGATRSRSTPWNVARRLWAYDVRLAPPRCGTPSC